MIFDDEGKEQEVEIKFETHFSSADLDFFKSSDARGVGAGLGQGFGVAQKQCAREHALGAEQVAEIARSSSCEGDVAPLAVVTEGKWRAVRAHEKIEVATVGLPHAA